MAAWILTCSGVSFFHGGNDGQKGMGLIMLILIGTVPTAYALNRTMHEQDVTTFVAVAPLLLATSAVACWLTARRGCLAGRGARLTDGLGRFVGSAIG